MVPEPRRNVSSRERLLCPPSDSNLGWRMSFLRQIPGVWEVIRFVGDRALAAWSCDRAQLGFFGLSEIVSSG